MLDAFLKLYLKGFMDQFEVNGMFIDPCGKVIECKSVRKRDF